MRWASDSLFYQYHSKTIYSWELQKSERLATKSIRKDGEVRGISIESKEFIKKNIEYIEINSIHIYIYEIL